MTVSLFCLGCTQNVPIQGLILSSPICETKPLTHSYEIHFSLL